VDQEIISVIKRVFDAVERRDNAIFEAAVHPEVELHWPPQLPYGGVRRGTVPDGRGWGAFWGPLQPTEAERRLDPRIVASNGEEVIVLWRQRGLAPSGDRIDTPVLGLYRIVDGRLVRGQMFYFDAQAVVRFIESAQKQSAGNAPGRQSQ
jgi:ketosteroid isomerase-like protein